MKKQTPLMLLVLACLVSASWSQTLPPASHAGVKSALVDTLRERPTRYRKKPHIAILPFSNANAQAKEAEFGRTVSSMLATALRNQTNFVVLERSQLQKVLNEQILERTGLTSEQTEQLSKLYNVEVVLVGDVSLINTTLHIDARLIATRSSEIVVALYGTCQDLRQIRDVVEDLSRQLEQTYLRQWMGSISISSQPAGSEVYLEEKFIGLTSEQIPLRVDNMLEGSYRLKLIRGGYFDWQSDIAVPAKMERAVTVSLIAKPGSMNVYSEPAGARVFLDNTPVGETPMSLKQVAEGEHELSLVKENYKDWRQRVVVRSFQPTDVKATLEVSPGMLTVNSEPANAEIFLKGKQVARTPHTLSNIPPGEVAVRVTKPGYETWTSSILIGPSNHQVLDISLVEKRGSLSILSQPEGATVYLHKPGQTPREIGQTPVLNYETTIGLYQIEVKKPDYFAATEKTAVAHKTLSDVAIELQEKPGSILVESEPVNARISLDGSFKGRTPYLLENIVKGDYQVAVSLPYAEEIREVHIKPNRQAVVKANFRKSKKYIMGISAAGVASLLFHLMAQ